jgi:hypothetical protein
MDRFDIEQEQKFEENNRLSNRYRRIQAGLPLIEIFFIPKLLGI